MELLLKYFPSLTEKQQEQFSAMGDLYREWNAKINVVSRKDIDLLEERHILHSLAIARAGMITPGERILDVGTGGGFPGIPLAVFYPDVEFTLVDSIGKKIRVVQEVSEALELKNVRAVHCRVEELDGGKSRFDWIVSRAVTELKTLLKWTWNRSDRGVLFLKGGDLTDELAAIGDLSKKVQLRDISKWFDEEFFETKKVLILPKK